MSFKIFGHSHRSARIVINSQFGQTDASTERTGSV